MKIRAAGKYFSYIGKNFPVMCASGAFSLMPPVAEAGARLDKYDDLSQKGIANHVAKLRKFRSEFEQAAHNAESPSDKATANALARSAACAIAELDTIRTWENSPAMYLQVAFTGLSQATDMPCDSTRVREKRFLKRLKAIPALLATAATNVQAISPAKRSLAQTMIRDCARYLNELEENDLGRIGKAPAFLNGCLIALRDFDRFVATIPEIPEADGPPFGLMTNEILGSTRSPDEIYTIAEEEFQRRKAAIHDLVPEVGGDWKKALAQYAGPDHGERDAHDIIVREIHLLRGFVFDKLLSTELPDSALRISALPLHLASTLRPIHYDPALGVWPDEPSRCYVSPQIFTGRGFRDDPIRLQRMRREYRFMAARQTYPGRHLLDTQRRALNESPLSQITSPLFVAGWLAFSENLLEELGYFSNPMDRLVHHQRGMARAALAIIDAGLAVGNIDVDKCLKVLTDAGFSREESLERIGSIRVAPASRIAPVLGQHEIQTLREKSGLELTPFCHKLLGNGQLSFDDLARIMTS